MYPPLKAPPHPNPKYCPRGLTVSVSMRLQTEPFHIYQVAVVPLSSTLIEYQAPGLYCADKLPPVTVAKGVKLSELLKNP